MKSITDVELINKISDALVYAGSTFSIDKKKAYQSAINNDVNEHSKWALKMILENAEIAEKNKSPLCDDTGIPHLVLDVGQDALISNHVLDLIQQGIKQGLRKLPGRPMAVLGNEVQRLDQQLGMDDDPGALEPAPILIRKCDSNTFRLHILMFGGGPAIRGKTYRVFHQHEYQNVINTIVEWGIEATALLGCTPCTIAVGVGRSQYEASCMMVESLLDGNYEIQNDIEREITQRINEKGVGALSLGGKTTVLATFMKVGPQRASGIRVVCMRPCCCFEPRIGSVELNI